MIVAGIGCRGACPAADIVALVWRAARACAVTPDRLAVPENRRDHPALPEAAARLGLATIIVPRDDMLAMQPRCLTRSSRVRAATGLAAIAEAAALAAAGPAGRLLLPRLAGGGATCAIAATA